VAENRPSLTAHRPAALAPCRFKATADGVRQCRKIRGVRRSQLSALDAKPVCSGSLTEREALARNCWPAPEVMANMNTDQLGNLGLAQAEERAIVAFIGTPSDGYTPAAGRR
jgi:hypothetical protein